MHCSLQVSPFTGQFSPSALSPQRFPSPSFQRDEIHYMLVYFIWFFSTGVIGGYLHEARVMRYMTPKISQHDIEGYSALYSNLPVSTKASGFRFAHIAPDLPRTVLETWRNSTGWKVLEGLCGPSSFSSVNGQARLAQRDNSMRQFWESANDGASAHDDKTRVIVVFGEDNLLLKSYKDILVVPFILDSVLTGPRLAFGFRMLDITQRKSYKIKYRVNS